MRVRFVFLSMAETMAEEKVKIEEKSSENVDEIGAAAGDNSKKALPTCIIVLGMAGSGKTTFVQVRISFFSVLHAEVF